MSTEKRFADSRYRKNGLLVQAADVWCSLLFPLETAP